MTNLITARYRSDTTQNFDPAIVPQLSANTSELSGAKGSNFFYGLNVVHIDASTGERGFCISACDETKSSRTAGIATVYWNKQTTNPTWLPGHMIQVVNSNSLAVETGPVPILSSTSDASGLTLTYADPRPDIALGKWPSGTDILDRCSYSVTSCWLQFAQMYLQGKLEMNSYGVGGTNLPDWVVERLDRAIALGLSGGKKIHLFVLGGGIIGNSIASLGYSSEQIYTELVRIHDYVIQRCPGVVFGLESTSNNRNITAASNPAYVTGYRHIQNAYQRFIGDYPNTILIPWYEATLSNYGAYNIGSNTPELLNGWEPALFKNTDGTHQAQPGARLRGAAWSKLQKMFVHFPTEMQSLAESVTVAAQAGNDGTEKILNIATGMFGKLTTKACTVPTVGTVGVMPVEYNITGGLFAAGMSAVAYIKENPEGGNDFNFILTDPVGSGGGPFLTVDWVGINGNDLVTALNLASNSGKRIRIFHPFGINITNEFSLLSVEVGMFATVNGVEYHLGGPLADVGLYKCINQGRAFNWGFAGCMRDTGQNGIIVPTLAQRGGFAVTAASLRTVIKGVPSNAPLGVMKASWKAGLKIEFI